MNSDLILTVGATILFSVLVYNTHSNIILSTEKTIQTEYLNTAIDLSETLMMEIISKSFDEKTINATPDISSLSSKLGKDGEVYPDFDDLDDYNGYKVSIKTKYSDSFTSEVKVQYVNPDNYSPSSTQTSMKKITISTYAPSLVDTVIIDFYSSY